VDVYQLDYFPAVCAKGETPQDETVMWVNFYLYHATEKKIRIPKSGGGSITIDIEPTDVQIAKLKFSNLLTLYGVQYTDDTDLEELEASFWAKFFESPPNDEFDPDQYCHSPWFEKCCGERRSVKELKDRQDWDRIYLKWMPRKTINLFPATLGTAANPQATFPKGSDQPFTTTCPLGGANNKQTTEAPTQVQVVQYDLDTIGVKLIDYPVYPDDQINGSSDSGIPALPADFLNELKVMLLLKA
jgi:hypothetical protein